MKNFALILLTLIICFTSSYSQNRKVGGLCEGCEAIYESPTPFEKIKSFVELPDVSWDGKKPMGINGTVYKADGKTPAPGVVLYLHHTDAKGK